MRLIDKMGIDPNTVEGVAKIMRLRCQEIPDKKSEEYKRLGKCKHVCRHKPCSKCKAERLFAEIPAKKRWDTLETAEDLSKAYESFCTFCDNTYCSECRYGILYGYKAKCFIAYLLEEIGVEE